MFKSAKFEKKYNQTPFKLDQKVLFYTVKRSKTQYTPYKSS